jgi:methionine-R-sulfoxide reductase
MVIFKGRRSALLAALTVLVAVFSIACGSGPASGEAIEQHPLNTTSLEGGLAMPIIKKAEAANVCYVEPSEELRAKLGAEQYAVLVESATEPPFRNAYWDNHIEGVYVDAIDGAALFASTAKFDSGTGWPSFWDPIDTGALVLVEDTSLGMRRIEVRSKASGGHLGHLFNDGPQPTGLRYCINSASLRFIPRSTMSQEGYAELEARLFTP